MRRAGYDPKRNIYNVKCSSHRFFLASLFSGNPSKPDGGYILRYKYFALEHPRADAGVITPFQYDFGDVQKPTVIGRLLQSYLYRFLTKYDISIEAICQFHKR